MAYYVFFTSVQNCLKLLHISWGCIGAYIAVCFSVSPNCGVQHKNVTINACVEGRLLQSWHVTLNSCFHDHLLSNPTCWAHGLEMGSPCCPGRKAFGETSHSIVCQARCKDSFHSLNKVKSSVSYIQHSFFSCKCDAFPINDGSVVLEQVTKGSNKLLVLSCGPVLGIFNKQQ